MDIRVCVYHNSHAVVVVAWPIYAAYSSIFIHTQPRCALDCTCIYICRHVYLCVCIMTHTQSSLLRGQSMPLTALSLCKHLCAPLAEMHIYCTCIYIYRHVYVCMCIQTHTQSSLLSSQSMPRTALSI